MYDVSLFVCKCVHIHNMPLEQEFGHKESIALFPYGFNVSVSFK